MRNLLRCSGLLLLCAAFVLPAIGADKKTDDAKSDKKGPKGKTEEYVIVMQYDGVLKDLQVEEKKLSMEANVRSNMPDPAVATRLGQLQGQLAQQQSDGNFGAAQNTANEIAKVSQTLYPISKVDKQFELSERPKVRIQQLPVEVTEKGTQKRRTPAELKALKGPNPKEFGYHATLEQVAAGSNIRVFVGIRKSVYESLRRKKAAENKNPRKSKTKLPEITEEDLDGEQLAGSVRTIYILPDSPMPK